MCVIDDIASRLNPTHTEAAGHPATPPGTHRPGPVRSAPRPWVVCWLGVSKGGEQGRQARLVEELVDLAPPCDQLRFRVAEDLLTHSVQGVVQGEGEHRADRSDHEP